jgi:hypothetical protein
MEKEKEKEKKKKKLILKLQDRNNAQVYNGTTNLK